MATQKEVVAQLESLLAQRPSPSSRSCSHGHAIVVDKLEDAVAFAEDYAPEHLELMIAEADAISAQIKERGRHLRRRLDF